MLESAAVAGEPFDPDLAAAIAELDPADGLAALDALLEVDLVRPTAVPAALRLPPPARAPRGLRVLARRLAAGRTRSRRRRARRPRRRRRRARPPREQSAAPGDEDAIAVLLAAGSSSVARAPAAATRWFEAALRLLPGGDAERQVEVRVALASALRSTGELDRCRATLLEAVDLLPPDATARRVELTAWCAAVEHWQGRHEDAHRRLTRAWEGLPDRTGAAAAALQIELAIDGLYELDFEQTLSMGRAALETARGVGDRALLASAASALALGESAAGEIPQAREHLAEALALVDGLGTWSSPRGWRRSSTSAGPRTTSSASTTPVAHADRGIAIARAIGEGRLLVPLMLTKGYPFEAQGKIAEAIAVCEEAVEAARLAANPHYLFWAFFELGFALYYKGDLDGSIAAGEESLRVGHRLAGGTIPAAGGGPGWLIANARFAAGDVQRAREEMHALGSDELEHKIPSSAASTGRSSRWSSWRWATSRRRKATRGAARRTPSGSGSSSRTRWPSARRAAVLLAARRAGRGRRRAARSAEIASGIGAAMVAAFATGCRARRSPPRAAARTRSRCCAGPSPSSTATARCGCATSCAASCGGSAPARRCAAPRRPATQGSRR
jgi:tetratricopeptide (TPR) repeat protein